MAAQLDRFTKSMRMALTSAQTEAARSRRPQIETEHLLLGLLLQEQGTAAQLLQILGVTLPVVQAQIDQLTKPGQDVTIQKPTLAVGAKRAVELAVATAARWGHAYIGTEHLLVGLLGEGQGVAYQVLTALGVTVDKLTTTLPQVATVTEGKGATQRAAPSKGALRISPVFGAIVLVTVLAGYLTYQQTDQYAFMPRFLVFLFVIGGWLISVCLHEFSHALAAYYFGDRSVIHKGYLTLNPFKYTHPVLSILLPLLYMALGGIGLPGGAVYINSAAIPQKWQRSLTFAAGPLATALCALLILTPFTLVSVDQQLDHLPFWAGLALLAMLEVTALLFNLLPIPGLDGFGIISSYLPPSLLAKVRGFGAYTLLLIFLLFSNPTFSGLFWTVVRAITGRFIGLPMLTAMGFDLFRFWLNADAS